MSFRAMSAVVVGAMAGATARWGISEALPVSRFHWATLVVNCLGSLLLGLLAEKIMHSEPQRPNVGIALTAGFCGSLTTFSALALTIAENFQSGEVALGALVALSNCVLGLGLAVVGVKAQRRFNIVPDF